MSLFDVSQPDEHGRTLCRMSHRDDPHTSRLAAATHLAGAHKGHMAIVLQAVHDYPGCTAMELKALTQLGEYQVRRRLSDLKMTGLVTQGEARICKVNGTRMVTWFESPEKGEATEKFDH